MKCAYCKKDIDRPEIIANTPCIKDVNGVIWYYLAEEGRITPLESGGNPPDKFSGYWGETFEDAVHILKEEGFLQ
jgi:hypothetical protein